MTNHECIFPCSLSTHQALLLTVTHSWPSQQGTPLMQGDFYDLSDMSKHNQHFSYSAVNLTFVKSTSDSQSQLVSHSLQCQNTKTISQSLCTALMAGNLPAIRAVQGDCQWPLKWQKFLPVMSAHNSFQPRQLQPIFRPTNHKTMMPTNCRPCLISHWQSYCHQARTVKQSTESLIIPYDTISANIDSSVSVMNHSTWLNTHVTC